MKLIIAGGRDFNDLKLASNSLSVFMRNHKVSEIVSGGARGADQIGETLADLAGIPVKRFIPDWSGLGKRAGFVRNAEMGDYADGLLAFWNKQSKGTKQMIDYATKRGLIVEVVYYED